MSSTPASAVPPHPTPLGRQPALDGLRGVAILAVIFDHLRWGWLPGGFFGVDLFFTLSGFLITTLLLEEQFATGRIALGRFFARRAIRLYPALVALVAVSTAYGLLAHQRGGDPGRTFVIAASVLGYVANWATLFDTSGWFGGMPHTWSLAIEAQFYLLWALILFYVARRLPDPEKRGRLLGVLLAIAVAIVVVSAVWRGALWAAGASWLRTYLGTDTRLDCVFLGAAAALVRLRGLHRRTLPWPVSGGATLASVVEVACAVVIAVIMVRVRWYSALPGMVAFVVIGAATATIIVTVTMRNDTLLGRVLKNRVLVWFGWISYSLYIWHVPVSKFASSKRLAAAGVPTLAAELFRLVAEVGAAALSYYLIERTFLRFKRRFETHGSRPSTVSSH